MRSLTILFLGFWVLPVSAAWQDVLGLTALRNELGIAAPSGVGVTFSVVEAREAGNYLIQTTHVDFVGTTITDISAAGGATSSHATLVARYAFGNSFGVATNVVNVHNHLADDWLKYELSREGLTDAEPGPEPHDVQLHSWIGDPTEADGNKLNRLFDYQVQRDGVVAITSLRNDTVTAMPHILSQAYNSICVGRSDGQHSPGLTAFDEPGRSKPDLVAFNDLHNFTSFVVPIVGGAAALLLETARSTPGLAAADDPRVVKAVLMASADKTPFPGWTHSPAQPLDNTYGAGQLAMRRAYQLLTAGGQVPGEVPSTAWSFASLPANQVHQYHFRPPVDAGIAALNVSLNWYREVWDAHPSPLVFNAQTAMANMTVALYRTTNGVPDELIAYSDSAVDNVEYLFVTGLGAGEFLLQVETDRAVDYAMAWMSDSLPAPHILRLESLPGGDAEVYASVLPGERYLLQGAEAPDGPWSDASLPTEAVGVELMFPVANGAIRPVYRVLHLY